MVILTVPENISVVSGTNLNINSNTANISYTTLSTVQENAVGGLCTGGEAAR